MPLLLTPLPGPQFVHRIGRFAFSDDQLEDVLVCLEHDRGAYTTREVVLVFRYRWPSQFQFLLVSDLDLVMRWLIANRRAKSTSESLERTQIINTFKIELREAEVCNVLALAKRIAPDIVLVIRATKLYSNLSSLDIAHGLTNRCSKLVRGYRYVWMCPFTEMQVENIWNRSRLAKTKTSNYIGGKTRQLPTFLDLLEAFKRDVIAGRADEALRLDPRSCGNETSAANLVEEVVHLFLCSVASNTILEAVITEPVIHS